MEEQIAAELGFPLIDIPAEACVSAEGVIRELAGAAVPASAAPGLALAILAEEALLPSNIGLGVAIPHARRHPAFASPGGVVGRCAAPVQWPAQPPTAAGPVRLAVLVAAGPGQSQPYLDLLERVVLAVRRHAVAITGPADG